MEQYMVLGIKPDKLGIQAFVDKMIDEAGGKVDYPIFHKEFRQFLSDKQNGFGVAFVNPKDFKEEEKERSIFYSLQWNRISKVQSPA